MGLALVFDYDFYDLYRGTRAYLLLWSIFVPPSRVTLH